MKKRSFILLVLLTVILLVMTGCTRSATRAPRATATPEGGIPFPDPTQSQIMVDILAGTQTQGSLAGEANQAPATGGAESTQAPPTAPTSESVVMTFPTATPGVPATYTIQPDEFPFCISRRFNVNAGDLLSVNGLNMDSYVLPGFVLTLPQNSTYYGERALKPHPTDYTVQAGDTIGKIACSFGDVNPYNIYAVNGLEQGAALTTGQVLHIP